METLEKEIEDLESKLRDDSGDQVPPCFLVNGDFSKVLLEEPDGWEVASGTIDPKELAENRVGGGRKAVVIRQTFAEPIPAKTKLAVRVERSDSSSRPIGIVALWDSGSQTST